MPVWITYPATRGGDGAWASGVTAFWMVKDGAGSGIGKLPLVVGSTGREMTDLPFASTGAPLGSIGTISTSSNRSNSPLFEMLHRQKTSKSATGFLSTDTKTPDRHWGWYKGA